MTKLDDMIETFRGQVRNADRVTKVEELSYVRDEINRFTAVELTGSEGQIYHIILVGAGNIATCKGFWKCPHNLDVVEAVAVFYGHAQEQGAVADCEGNRFKDDYRRLAWAKDVWKLDGNVYGEIPWRLTEDNVKRLLRGQELS